MPPVTPVANGSLKGKEVAFFSDDEDFADGDAGSPVPLAPTRKRKLNDSANGTMANGHVPNGAAGPSKKAKKKANKGKGKKGSEEERARIAAELLLKRYELPFYQGRRMILDDVVNNDTVVVSRG